jgi:hypothetical protein
MNVLFRRLRSSWRRMDYNIKKVGFITTASAKKFDDDMFDHSKKM